MRRVSRPLAPEHLEGDGSVGRAETDSAIAFFAVPANAGKAFKTFRAYKHQSVATLLAEVFRNKCAYCESRFDHVAPADIEHFRPKGGIVKGTGSTAKPGYYWLAASWRNLLLSCIDCNRVRTHELSDGTRVKSGKGNHFPLVDEQYRATSPGAETLEKPLLLDPCEDDVDAIFKFSADGLISPAILQGLLHERAKTTIDVLGLQRPRLVARREERMIWVQSSVEKYRELRDASEKEPGNLSITKSLKLEMRDLKRWMSDTTEFSSMVHEFIRDSCPELFS